MAGRSSGWTLRLATLLFGEPRARRRERLDPRMLERSSETRSRPARRPGRARRAPLTRHDRDAPLAHANAGPARPLKQKRCPANLRHGQESRDSHANEAARAAPLQSLASERSLRTARLASGLVMMAFVFMHLGNLSLSLISLETAEAGRLWFLAIWRSLPGTVVLYAALLTHVALVLRSLYRRRSLVMPLREAAQVLAGLAIPLLVAQHVIGTRVFHELTEVPDTYEFVVRALWITSPGVGLTQAIALVVVWAHGCLGLHFWLRYRAWYPTAAPWLLIAAVLVPVVSLLAFAHAGQLGRADGAPAAARQRRPVADPRRARHRLCADRRRPTCSSPRWLPACLRSEPCAAAASVRTSSRSAMKAASRCGCRAATAFSEASRIAGIPHDSVCGGRGRCSTCRVRVIGGQDGQPLAGPVEELKLTRIRRGPDVRLACQLRPPHGLTRHAAAGRRPGARRGLSAASRRPPAASRRSPCCSATSAASPRSAEHRLPYDVVFLLNRYFAVVGKAVEQPADGSTSSSAMAPWRCSALARPAEACRQALAASAAIIADACAAERRTGRRHTGAAAHRHRHPCRPGDRRRHGLWRRHGRDGDRRHGQHRQPAGIGGQGIRRRDRHFRRCRKPVGHRHVGFRDARDRHPRQHPPASDPPRAGGRWRLRHR